jgi:predicted Fe-Mo cluster-binding NifX family protein
MKIAVASDDGKIISQDYDHARFYIVVTVEDGKMIRYELRHKLEPSFNDRWYSRSNQSRFHLSPTTTINDCDVLLCGGMRRENYDNLEALEIDPILTDIRTIGLALRTYLEGSLVNQAWRVYLFS